MSNITENQEVLAGAVNSWFVHIVWFFLMPERRELMIAS